MKILTARWVAGCIAAGSIALMAGALVLDVRGPASAAREHDGLGLLQRLRAGGEPGGPGGGLGSCFPAAREPDRLAVPGGGPGAGAESLRHPVRAACPGRGAGVLARGPGLACGLQLVWVISLVMLAFVFLLFPTGQLRSRRWRPAAWYVAAVFALAAVASFVAATRYWSHPFISFSSGDPGLSDRGLLPRGRRAGGRRGSPGGAVRPVIGRGAAAAEVVRGGCPAGGRHADRVVL